MNRTFVRKIVSPIFLSILLSALVPTIPGKDFWEEKSYKEWSERECREMLQNSPWSRDYTRRDVVILGTSDRTLSDGGQPYQKYQVQFRSALPIRRVVVRMAQIAQKYDGLNPAQKRLFDQQAEAFLAEDQSQAVIVYVAWETNQPTLNLSLAQQWKSQTTEALKNSVYLYGSKGERVPLAQFVPPQGAERSFKFIFPREYKGKKILGPEDKSLNLEFSGIYMEFKTDKMQINGKVEY